MKKSTPFGELEIFDAHAHFFSHRFFSALARQSPLLRRESDMDRRMSELTGFTLPPVKAAELGGIWAEELDHHRVSSALMIASLPGDEESVAEASAAYPDKITGAFMFDPTAPDAEATLKRAFDELSLRVVCLFPAMHRYGVAECEGVRAAASLAAERRGTAILVHCGALSVGIRHKLGLPSHFDLHYSNPLDLHLLAKEFGRTNFIIPHFGAGMFRETMLVADLCPNIYVDTSSSNKWMNYEPQPLDLQTVLRRAINVLGTERLLFGTDSSYFPRGWNSSVFEAQCAALGEVNISHEQAAAIFGGNLRRLLDLKRI